jgi:hypothetical protein
VIKDGDEVYVEYGPGPNAFSSRWEGRPNTPEFKWGDDGIVLPAHDIWLEQLDLVRENLDQLVDKEVKDQNSENLAKDLATVKALIKEHAGGLQACFLLYEFQVCSLVRAMANPASSCHLSLTQLPVFPPPCFGRRCRDGFALLICIKNAKLSTLKTCRVFVCVVEVA